MKHRLITIHIGRWCIHHCESLGLPAFNENKDANPIENLLTNKEAVSSSKATRVLRGEIKSTAGKIIPVYFKEYFSRSILDDIKHIIRPTRAQREAEASLLLKENDLASPDVLCWGFRKEGLFRKMPFIVTVALDNSKDIYKIMEEFETCKTSHEEKLEFINALALDIAKMHKLHIIHGDLRVGNILCRKNENRWEFNLIDNERTRKYNKLPEKLRIKNLVQLNMLISPALTRADRLRFFKTYSKAVFLENQKLTATVVIGKTIERLQKQVAKGKIQKEQLWFNNLTDFNQSTVST